MKLRIKGNTVRLRLLRSEVEQLSAEGLVSDEVRFGANGLKYSVVADTNAESIGAKFENGEIRIAVAEKTVQDWATSDQVSLEAEQPIGDDQTLSILVEKDFVCLDRPFDPDRADAYPNPQTDCKPAE